MGMYIRAREVSCNACVTVLLPRAKSSFSPSLFSLWQIQTTSTKTRFLFVRGVALETAMKIRQTIFYVPTNRAVCFYNSPEDTWFLNWKSVYTGILCHAKRALFSQIKHFHRLPSETSLVRVCSAIFRGIK